MLYLSEIINRPIRDRQGTEMAHVRDVVATLPPDGATDPVLPRLHGLVAGTGRGGSGFFVPVDRLGRLDGARITLDSPVVALEAYQRREGELLLTKDLWDHRVIDCATRRVRRVNDVVLGLPDTTDPATPHPPGGYLATELVVLGVDIGTSGILRRLGLHGLLGGLLGERLHPAILTWDRMDLVAAQGPAAARHTSLAGMHPVEIAHLTENVSTQEAAGLIAALDDETAAEVMEELPADRQMDIVEYLPDARAADILEEMDPDDASDLLGDLPDARTAALLEEMDPDEASEVRTLLRYSDTTAGGMMTTRFVSVEQQLTSAQTVKRLREEVVDKPELIYYVYIVEQPDDNRLVGVVSLRDLLLAEPEAVLRDFMDDQYLSVTPDEEDREVARKMAEYNLLALPVLDHDRHLLGIVTVDDALDVLLPKGWQRRLPRIFS